MVEGPSEAVPSGRSAGDCQVSRALRILLCCENYPPSVGGVQEVMRQIAERLAAKGHTVTVATSSHPERGADLMRKGVRVVSFPIAGNWIRGFTGPVESYREFLREHACDAMLIKAAQQWTFDAALEVLPGITGRKLFIPCGFSGLTDPAYAAYFQEMPRWLSLFDGLVFYSQDYQDIDFARRHGLARIHCLSNGVDEREFSDPDPGDIREALGIDPGHDLLLSVGSLIAAKGHWEVLRAFGQACLPRPATWVLNGNVPGAGQSVRIRRALKHGLSGRWPLAWEAKRLGVVTRAGAQDKRMVRIDLPRQDLVHLYKAADLFVSASHVEYSPLVLFEAAAAGTPFLASAAGNSREIAAWTGAGRVLGASVGNTSSGVLVAELARAMEEMLADRPKLAAMGVCGRQAVFKRGFTWEQIVERYEALLGGFG